MLDGIQGMDYTNARFSPELVKLEKKTISKQS